ncbi:hypothetical protein PGQ11_001880 [Apiospora arundinis]|uniref:Uncharacterized protein n=1 Tax=Apiospora arundinis TaxID=335852 RepID=A0ABR2JGF5_9PEZI
MGITMPAAPRNAEEMDVDPPAPPAPPPAPAPRPLENAENQRVHKVREMLILQCPDAQNNEGLRGPRDRRHCPIAAMQPMAEAYGEQMRGISDAIACPVCVAIAQAERDAMETERVIPPQTIDAERYDDGRRHNTRSSRRHHRSGDHRTIIHGARPDDRGHGKGKGKGRDDTKRKEEKKGGGKKKDGKSGRRLGIGR